MHTGQRAPIALHGLARSVLHSIPTGSAHSHPLRRSDSSGSKKQKNLTNPLHFLYFSSLSPPPLLPRLVQSEEGVSVHPPEINF